ncbi:hypothetical protein, partial [Neisseria cinerea]|uniref:hypothetical protein n=1 Tax=Neisseria cinerea TaxID=483 RepID=UPI0027E07DA5
EPFGSRFFRLCFNTVPTGILGFKVFDRIGFYPTRKIIFFSLTNSCNQRIIKIQPFLSAAAKTIVWQQFQINLPQRSKNQVSTNVSRSRSFYIIFLFT